MKRLILMYSIIFVAWIFLAIDINSILFYLFSLVVLGGLSLPLIVEYQYQKQNKDKEKDSNPLPLEGMK